MWISTAVRRKVGPATCLTNCKCRLIEWGRKMKVPPAKCRDYFFYVRRFTWLMFIGSLILTLEMLLILLYEGFDPYFMLLLLLTLVSSVGCAVNLVRLRRVQREPLAPNLTGRGYLVPGPWTLPLGDEALDDEGKADKVNTPHTSSS